MCDLRFTHEEGNVKATWRGSVVVVGFFFSFV